jgi:hypothetical protein
MKLWIQNAIDQWNTEGLQLNPPASASDIEKAEACLSFHFPEDFKELYSIVNGFADFEIRGFMLSLWSLDRIIDDYTASKKFIMFSDFSISVCQYGFDKDKIGVFKAYTHHQQGSYELVTESFQEMIELINTDSELLF